jgi:hypothetical protein
MADEMAKDATIKEQLYLISHIVLIVFPMQHIITTPQ